MKPGGQRLSGEVRATRRTPRETPDGLVWDREPVQCRVDIDLDVDGLLTYFARRALKSKHARATGLRGMLRARVRDVTVLQVEP